MAELSKLIGETVRAEVAAARGLGAEVATRRGPRLARGRGEEDHGATDEPLPSPSPTKKVGGGRGEEEGTDLPLMPPMRVSSSLATPSPLKVSPPAPHLRRPVQAAFSSPPPPSPGDALEDDDDVQLHDDESCSGDEAPCDMDDDDDDLDGFPTRAHKRAAIKAAVRAADGMSSVVTTAAAAAAASGMFAPAAAAAQAPPLRADSAPLDETSFPVHTEDPAVGPGSYSYCSPRHRTPCD